MLKSRIARPGALPALRSGSTVSSRKPPAVEASSLPYPVVAAIRAPIDGKSDGGDRAPSQQCGGGVQGPCQLPACTASDKRRRQKAVTLRNGVEGQTDHLFKVGKLVWDLPLSLPEPQIRILRPQSHFISICPCALVDRDEM